MQMCNGSLLHGTRRTQYISFMVLGCNAFLVHSSRSLLAWTTERDASADTVHRSMNSFNPPIEFHAAVMHYCPTLQI